MHALLLLLVGVRVLILLPIEQYRSLLHTLHFHLHLHRHLHLHLQLHLHLSSPRKVG